VNHYTLASANNYYAQKSSQGNFQRQVHAYVDLRKLGVAVAAAAAVAFADNRITNIVLTL